MLSGAAAVDLSAMQSRKAPLASSYYQDAAPKVSRTPADEVSFRRPHGWRPDRQGKLTIRLDIPLLAGFTLHRVKASVEGNMPEQYLIGRAAAAAGLTTKTLRYYEAMGLLPPPDRTESGYRVYSPAEVRRLGFIVKAKRLGLTLREIREILTIRDGGGVPCIHVQHLLQRKVEEVGHQIVALTALRVELRRLARRCGREIRQGGQAAVCPHVESLPAVSPRPRAPGRS